jgi:hypothetical protein
MLSGIRNEDDINAIGIKLIDQENRILPDLNLASYVYFKTTLHHVSQCGVLILEDDSTRQLLGFKFPLLAKNGAFIPAMENAMHKHCAKAKGQHYELIYNASVLERVLYDAISIKAKEAVLEFRENGNSFRPFRNNG